MGIPYDFLFERRKKYLQPSLRKRKIKQYMNIACLVSYLFPPFRAQTVVLDERKKPGRHIRAFFFVSVRYVFISIISNFF